MAWLYAGLLAEAVLGAVALVDQVGQVVAVVGRPYLALADSQASLEVLADSEGSGAFGEASVSQCRDPPPTKGGPLGSLFNMPPAALSITAGWPAP